MLTTHYREHMGGVDTYEGVRGVRHRGVSGVRGCQGVSTPARVSTPMELDTGVRGVSDTP